MGSSFPVPDGWHVTELLHVTFFQKDNLDGQNCLASSALSRSWRSFDGGGGLKLWDEKVIYVAFMLSPFLEDLVLPQSLHPLVAYTESEDSHGAEELVKDYKALR